MRWSEGGIPNAIQSAKANKSVFIVFIAAEDAQSKEMEDHLNSEDMTGLCEENQCVAVKIAGGSNECKFFSQIYPVVVIPSTFFIGDTGIPLEVIGECKSHEDFLAKVKNAIELQKKSSAEMAQASSSSSAPVQQQQSSEATAASATVSSQEEDVPEEGAVAGSGDDSAEKKEDENLEEKVERARILLEQKRQEKMRKEAEEERRREIERRQIGQGVQKLKEQQREQELLEAKKERLKEKEEEKAARRRVKEEIERDRAEKAARFGKMKEERNVAAEEAKKKMLLEEQAAQAEEQARRSDIARIQFRMPDGSSVTQQFPATDTFDTVHQFITQHMNGQAVRLSMTFPRRTFTTADHASTLQELQLAPSAAILVLPGNVSTSNVRSSEGALSLSGITRLVFAPILFLWNLIASIFGFSGGSSSSSSSAAARSGGAAHSASSTASGGDRNPGGAQKRPSSQSRQEGSIRRFRNAQDDKDDDDTNTWNGNSTQQM